ncbi:dynamin family protein [Streptomyces olindensis]|uniref:dynamin family protein n=1 Tax=Streptomyces olindensis TaxID=358823 RepID=UPI0036475DF0
MKDATGGDARYVEEHAKDAIDLLEEVLRCLAHAIELKINWSGHPDREAGSVRAVTNQLKAVRQGELRMAVVAPMKAGKSTLVNAIAGYELLPARAAAMTTLPTRIVLERAVGQDALRSGGNDPFGPLLEVAEEDAELFGVLLAALREQLRTDTATVKEKFPHLEELLQDIAEGRVSTVSTHYEGKRAVQQALMLLNDLVRLAGVLLPGDRVRELSDSPVVRTPYWTPEAVEETSPGQLVIVDTPGPDEDDLSAVLGDIVSRQLSESHIVLVILDYTKMGGQSDALIRDLMEPLLRAVGQDKLFAVVNKIDQRKKKSGMSDEELARSVAFNLGLGDAADDRIFTTAADRALMSVGVLAELELRGSSFEAAQSESALQLLQLAHPLTWEEDLEEADANGMRKLAQVAWERSGLPHLLSTAITGLRARALPLAVESALKVVASELSDLRTAVRARHDLIGRESKELATAATQITGEIDEVARFRQRVAAPEELVAELTESLSALLDGAKKEGKVTARALGDRVRKDSLQDGNLLKKVTRHKRPGTVEFNTKAEAQAYMQSASASAQAALAGLLERTRSQIEHKIRISTQQQVQKESAKIQPIVDRAAVRLRDEFAIVFTMPDLALPVSAPQHPDGPEIETKTSKQKVKEEVHERSFRRLWLWKSTFTKEVEKEVTTHTYLVKSDAMQKSLQASFDERLNEIHSGLRGHVRESMVDRINQYYDEVEAFLQRYRLILEQSANDNVLQEKAKEELRDSLHRFQVTVEQHLRSVEDLGGR